MLLPSAHHQPTQSHGPKIRTRSQNPARPRPRWSPRATPGRRETRRQPPAQGLSPPSARAHPVPAFRGTSVPHGPRAGEPTCVRRPAMEIGYLPCAGPVPPTAGATSRAVPCASAPRTFFSAAKVSTGKSGKSACSQRDAPTKHLPLANLRKEKAKASK
jgi:hypothetical protein